MMIENDAALRQYIPNALVTVEGEQSLFDKMAVELSLSESWFRRTFSGTDTSDAARKIVATDAFIRAVPSLDLVLTPNGFGIVSNNTIAPASKDRVDRLLASLERSRDFAIDELLHALMADASWTATAQGRHFLATLFPTPLALPEDLHKGKAWECFCRTRAQIILIERQLAEHYISEEVYARLRNASAGTPTEDEAMLIASLQAVELDLLQGLRLPYKKMVSLVDHIRKRAEEYPEWQTSATAELYKPHRFENRRHSSGYFF